MKPAAAISAVVVAVLVTVVIEETRIKQLNDEIIRLRALPVPEETPVTEPSSAAAPDPAVPDAEEAPAPAEVPEPAPGLRQVPESYPAPDKKRIQEVAQSPYSQLHYELNLTNRERSYLEELLFARQLEQQQLAGRWLDALPEDRATIEKSITEIDTMTMDRVREFLGDEADFATFTAYHDRQPDREQLAKLAPMMDQEGVALELEKELAIIDAMHEARSDAGAIDWDSLAGMKAIAEGGALERFEEEWAKTGENLSARLGDLLDEKEAAAFTAAREQLKEAQLETLKDAIEAVK